jgi:hypothetical protein
VLAEIWILRFEAIIQASNAPTLGVSDTRFVPVKLPVSPIKDSQPARK